MYKYTYQDWLDGKALPDDLLESFYKKEVPYEDYFHIRKDQEKAFLNRIKGTLEQIKEALLEIYECCWVKDDFLEIHIDEIENDVLAIKTEDEAFVRKIAFGGDEYTTHTIEEIKKYHDNWTSEQGAFKGVYESLYKQEDITQFDYIIKANILSWLKWLKKQRELDNKEPFINYTIRANIGRERFEKGLLDRKFYTWKSIFKDPAQADKIMILLDEYLSSSGQWIKEPKGRYLGALYTELQSKGY